jgi:hypothetical protein
MNRTKNPMFPSWLFRIAIALSVFGFSGAISSPNQQQKHVTKTEVFNSVRKRTRRTITYSHLFSSTKYEFPFRQSSFFLFANRYHDQSLKTLFSHNLKELLTFRTVQRFNLFLPHPDEGFLSLPLAS